MNKQQFLDLLPSLNTYQDFVHQQSLDKSFSQQIKHSFEKFNVDNNYDWYKSLNPTISNICKYCNSNILELKTIWHGYKTSCSNKECKSKYLSEQVTLSYKNMSQEDIKLRHEKISKTAKARDKTIDAEKITEEFLLQSYPELNNVMSNEDIISFYNEHSSKTKHITKIIQIFWGCKDRETLYDKIYGTKYCIICNSKAGFINFNDGYRKTCNSKECICESAKRTKVINGVNYNRYEEYIDETFLLSLYPELHGDMNLNEIKEFCDLYSYNYRHIIMVGRIFWKCNTIQEIYNLINGNTQCVVCGADAKFNSYGSGYYKTCGSKKCIDTVSFRTKLKTGGNIKSIHSIKKMEDTCLLKYGVRNIAQSGLYSSCGGYKWYTYKLPSGDNIRHQGYEGRYIPILIRAYGENNIIFNKADIPKFKYIENGVERYYFPDFYIPSRKLVIEIKSKYTLDLQYTRNKLKFQAVLDAGYNLKVKVYKK